MDTTLYYTFSTIAQTLAGAIGLLGAFVLFRLQALERDLEDVSITVLNCYVPSPDRDAVTQLHHSHRYREMLAFTSQHEFTDASAKTPFIAYRCAQLPLLVKQGEDVHRWLRASLGLTVSLIAAAVAALALTPVLGEPQAVAVAVLAIGWTWLVSCLLAYAKLLQVTLK